MVVLTNDILDSNGNPVTTDVEYQAMKYQVATSPSDFETARGYVNAMESAAEAEGIDRSGIILSFQFTVQSIGTVMNSAKTLYIDAPFAAGATPVTSFGYAGDSLGGAADLYAGTFALKYMLGVPSAQNPIAPLNTFWKAAIMKVDTHSLARRIAIRTRWCNGSKPSICCSG